MPKITNICKDAAQDIIYLPNNTVLISISEEHDPEWNLKVKGLQQLPDNLKYLKKVKIFSLFSSKI